MYRRSLRPRWREITASVLVIAVLGSSAGILAGKPSAPSAPGDQYLDERQTDDLRGIHLVGHG